MSTPDNYAGDMDRQALLEMYDLYHRPVFQYLAYQLGGRIEVAEELCEHVFMEALRSSPPGMPRSSWLYQLATAAVNDFTDRPAHRS